MTTKRNRIIALAGVFQAAALVQQLANTGKFELKYANILIESVFTLEAVSIDDIYKNLLNLQYGLDICLEILTNNHYLAANREITRYALSIIYLERCLTKRKDLLAIIKKRLLRSQHQTQNFIITHDNIMANLASIYTDTLSTLKFRIHINGEQHYLTPINNVNKIRALLLAGIRAAVLWRQMGGARWQLIFTKKQLIKEAQSLLTELNQA